MTHTVTKELQRGSVISQEIDVLLATYNGEKYLQELLDSLASQREVSINLIASDDGSTDQTRTILERNRNKFKKFTILDGPQRGPAQNFLFLLGQSTSEFAAFADQDDIWGVDHLRNSIARLRNHDEIPALSFSAVTRFYESGQESEVWPQFKQVPDISRLYIECPALGCTMVMNRSAVNLVNSHQTEFALMHDFWALLIMKTCGEVLFGSAPEINYRIHADNVCGLGERSAAVTIQKIKNKRWQPYLQLFELYDAFGGSMKPEYRRNIRNVLDALEGGLSKRIPSLVLTRKRFRTEIYDELRTRGAFLFFPLLFETKKNVKRD